MTPKNDYKFLNRDLSWLSFNHRVLQEAGRETVPLMEKIRFLSIYSSNLDEFYRVRMPALRALEGLSGKTETKTINRLLSAIHEKVIGQLKVFGTTLRDGVLPELRQQSIAVIYDQPIPEPIREPLETYFSHHVAAYIQVVNVSGNTHFFPENNKLYLVVSTGGSRKNRQLHIVKIPSDSLPRFYSVEHQGTRYIIFLDDIIKLNLARILGEKVVTCRSFKITRDAELDLQDEFAGNLAKKIEKKILQRDQGLATRFLYEPGMQKQTLAFLKDNLGLKSASFIQGGTYHNLKDLSSLPLKEPHFQYEPWTRLTINLQDKNKSLFDETVHRDILLHTPYHAYDTILRFFNEAAIDPAVTRIYVTLYRVASDSRIVNALISAAKNGKKVTVFVELKARFDEANNIRWSKKMKAAGVRIIESIPGLKVHAKLALVKRKNGERTQLLGLFATGNFNENTAHYYTDHILLTAAKPLLKEAEDLFRILRKGKKKKDLEKHKFDHLLVGQYNLQEHFIELIGREISNAKAGTPASIIIKFNNLEDKVLIENLYEASAAGVKISLIVRGICCLVPGVDGMSENITVRRIIDRYLEHGRVFIFHNNGDPEVYLGSADWMNRNIYRRIEVCFPVYEPELKKELMDIVDIQLKDNCQAVMIDELGNNLKIEKSVDEEVIRSQKEIGEMVGTLNKV